MESDIYSYLSVYLDLPDEKGAEKEKKQKRIISPPKKPVGADCRQQQFF